MTRAHAAGTGAAAPVWQLAVLDHAQLIRVGDHQELADRAGGSARRRGDLAGGPGVPGQCG